MAKREMTGPIPHPGAAAKGSSEAAVYRLFDDAGQLLYVGMGRNPMARWATHAEQEWWAKISRFTVEWHTSRQDARVAEWQAIRSERPMHNVQGTPRGALATGNGVRAALIRQREHAAAD